MNDILEANGKYLVMSTLDRSRQCVLGQYKEEGRTKQVLDSIDNVITKHMKADYKTLIIEVPKE